MKAKKKRAVFTLLLVLLLIMLASMLFGAATITPRQVISSVLNRILGLFTEDVTVRTIIWDIRIPRIILAAIVGLLLSTSGVILQGILRNPLADPYILGVSSGASIGAMASFIFGLDLVYFGFRTTPLLAFVSALIAVLIVYRLSHVSGRTSPETLILAGVAVSAFAAAVLALMIIVTGDLRAIFFWLLGSFADASWADVFAVTPYAIIGIIAAYFYSKDLNALLLGEEMALSLGVDVEIVRVFLLVIASLMTAAAVSVCGLIGFVGLIIPHFVRLIIGPNHRFLIPMAAISGMLLLVFADIVARVAFAPTEIPIGIIMAIIGAPFFIYILRKRRLLR
jgi:iron complex transport system permease protein